MGISKINQLFIGVFLTISLNSLAITNSPQNFFHPSSSEELPLQSLNNTTSITAYEAVIQRGTNQFVTGFPNSQLIIFDHFNLVTSGGRVHINVKIDEEAFYSLVDQVPSGPNYTYKEMWVDNEFDLEIKNKIMKYVQWNVSQGLASSFPINVNRVENPLWSKNLSMSCIVIPGSNTYQQNEFINAFSRLNIPSKVIIPVEHIVTFLFEHELGHCKDTDKGYNSLSYAENQMENYADLMAIAKLIIYYKSSPLIDMIPRIRFLRTLHSNEDGAKYYLPLYLVENLKLKLRMLRASDKLKSLSENQLRLMIQAMVYGNLSTKPLYQKKEHDSINEQLDRLGDSPFLIFSKKLKFQIPTKEMIKEANKYSTDQNNFNDESLNLILKFNEYVSYIFNGHPYNHQSEEFGSTTRQFKIKVFKQKLKSLLDLLSNNSKKQTEALDRWLEVLERQLSHKNDFPYSLDIESKIDIIKSKMIHIENNQVAHLQNSIHSSIRSSYPSMNQIYAKLLNHSVVVTENHFPHLNLFLFKYNKMVNNNDSQIDSIKFKATINHFFSSENLSYRILGDDYAINEDEKSNISRSIHKFLSKGTASSFPIDLSRIDNHLWENQPNRNCAIVTTPTSITQKQYVNSMTGLNLKTPETVPPEHMHVFRLEHELGHCKDVNLHDDRTFYAMTQGEIFADLTAIFHIYKYYGNSPILKIIQHLKFVASVAKFNTVSYLPQTSFNAALLKIKQAESEGNFQQYTPQNFMMWAKEITYGYPSKNLPPVYTKADHIMYENQLERLENSYFTLDKATSKFIPRSKEQITIDNHYVEQEDLKFNEGTAHLIHRFNISIDKLRTF